jgi:predicted dehydrogenase
MSESSRFSRRDFVRKTTACGAAGVAAPLFVSARSLGQAGKPGANDRIGVGLIGAGLMGTANLNNCAKFDDVAVTGICDVWKSKRERLVERFRETAKPYHDYREMLQQDGIDGVIVATPPHWHALQAIHACEANKAVYVQKPMTIYPAEGLALKRAAEKHGVITQVGTQIHAGDNYRRVVEYVRSGNLGRVSVVRNFLAYNRGVEGLGDVPDSQPPEDLDWDLWLGPAPKRPYNEVLARSAAYTAQFMAYSGGMVPGMAPHICDLPYWALGLGFPTLTSCSGGRYVIEGIGDAPDTQEVLWQYPDLTMTWMGSAANSYGFDFQGKPGIRRRLGIYFHGVNGTLFSDYHTHHVVPEGDRMKDAETPEPSIPPSPGHEREWLDCIKSGRQPSCNVFYHYKLDVACTLANLALKLGRSIRFDPASEKIVGDDEAARLAVPEYRKPWAFPKEYLES